MSVQKPTVGRIVHVPVCGSSGFVEDRRPAIIVRVWNDTCVNLQVFIDGRNDYNKFVSGRWISHEEVSNGYIWITSANYIDEFKHGAFWTWPPRV